MLWERKVLIMKNAASDSDSRTVLRCLLQGDNLPFHRVFVRHVVSPQRMTDLASGGVFDADDSPWGAGKNPLVVVS